jgi:hypothetical protein
MQMRTKAYLHFMSLWRSFRNALPQRHGAGSAEASPFLIFAAVVLALLFAILEIDRQQAELKSLGLLGGDYAVEARFLSP